jgi:hypothetical protein
MLREALLVLCVLGGRPEVIIPMIILLNNVTTMKNEAVMICIFSPFVSGIWKATTADLVSA